MTPVETEIGTVLETRAGRARVEVSPGGMCSQCELASSCLPASDGGRIIEVADPIGVAPGLRVRIELTGGKIVAASFLAYVVPLAGLVAGALIGFYAAAPASTELWGGIGAAAGLTAGFLVSRTLGQRLANRGRLTPIITGVIAQENGAKDKEKDRHGD